MAHCKANSVFIVLAMYILRAKFSHLIGRCSLRSWSRTSEPNFTKGVDLSGNEVKSAENGGNYEYQYHKNTGQQKLRDDMRVGHLFFDHKDNLRSVDLRYASGEALAAFFQKWLTEFPDPYQQRYRKNIPFRWVQQNAKLLMSLRDGEVTYPLLQSANSEEARAGVAPSTAKD